MKKSNLWEGLVFTALGLFLLLMVLAGPWESSLVCGLGGGAVGSGLVMVWKYCYWSVPGREEQYQEKLEEERIRLHDELLEKLRDRSGRYAYLLGLLVNSMALLILGLLKEFGGLMGTRPLILYLGAYLVFQWVAGIVIFRVLKKRY